MRRLLALTCGLAGVPAVAAPVDFEVGATIRLRGESLSGRPFGTPGPGDDTYVLGRSLLNAEARQGDVWTAKIELGWHEQVGRTGGPGPTDKGAPDVRQAWVELGIVDGVRVRAGRQEFALGGSRLVSVRDGPNLRRVFDGALATATQGAWRGQAFVLRPVDDRRGWLDDRTDDGQLLTGAYLTRQGKATGVDLYYLYLDRDAGRFGAVTASERRHSVGVRWFGRQGAVDHDFEAVAQRGRFGQGRIAAWTLASDTGVTRGRVRFGLKANITSGDRDPSDTTLGTFNPLFPNLTYFNDAALLAPQNHIDLHPSLTVTLAPGLQAFAGVDWFWKTRRADDVYRGPGLPVGAAGGSRAVGRQSELNLRWRPGASVEVRLSYVRFDIGPALRAIGGTDTDFGMISFQSRW